MSLITLSEQGVAIYDGELRNHPTQTREVSDVTGAGDTVLASLGFALSCELDIDEAVKFANLAAGVVIGKIGSATATLDITVNDVAPSSISYSPSTFTETRDTAMTSVTPTVTGGGPIVTWEVHPLLPSGLSIDSSTGEITFKTAPDYENPGSTSAVNSGLSDFSAVGANQMRWYNQYAVRVIADDGSGEANATRSSEVYINVRNLPDYAGYDPTNKLPFFKDMWGDDAVFIDDAASQSIQILSLIHI